MRFLVLTGGPFCRVAGQSTVNGARSYQKSGGSQSSKQRTVRVRAVVKFAVDKEGRSSVYSVLKAARYIFLYAFRECAGSQLANKKGGHPDSISARFWLGPVFESVLIFEQKVVHLPKVPSCGFRQLRRRVQHA